MKKAKKDRKIENILTEVVTSPSMQLAHVTQRAILQRVNRELRKSPGYHVSKSRVGDFMLMITPDGARSLTMNEFEEFALKLKCLKNWEELITA